MEETCKDFHEYDQESLAQLDDADLLEVDNQEEEDEENDEATDVELDNQEEKDEENDEATDVELDRRVGKNIKNTYKKTYGKTKKQIDA